LNLTDRDFELLTLQADVLFVHDGNNRLLRINESDAENPAPRFFLARSTGGNLWRVSHDLPADIAAELERLAASEPVVNDLQQPPAHLSTYTELLEQNAPVSDVESGPAYYLAEDHPPNGVVTITAENAHLLETNFPYTRSTLDERSPVVVTVADGTAIAAAYTARNTAKAAEVGVFTEEAYRGRGYAVEIVRGWAQAVRTTGRLPFYSTSWENTASQAVARKLGAVQYGVDFHIT
jgi:predicted GNAT family acetyltransferase